MRCAIETRRLTKVYPPRRSWLRLGKVTAPPLPAVQDVSLRVPEGEIFGLLGPNGAGKTTLIKMLTTLIEPTRGTARVAGVPLGCSREVRSRVGLVTANERSFYWRLSGLQNLAFFAALQGTPAPAQARCEALLEQVGLAHAARQRVGEYSTGMRKRLAIARALLHDPPLLFFDEPTSGLDPQATLELHHLILKMAARGKTVLLCTHVLVEAEKLCHRVGILHRGRLRAAGTVAELRREISWEPRFHIQVEGLPAAARRTLESRLGALRPAADAPPGTDFTLRQEAALPFVLEHIPAQHLRALIPERPSLDEIFAQLMEQPPADAAAAAAPPAGEPASPCGPLSAGRAAGAPATPRGRPFFAFLRRDWHIERSYRLAFVLKLARMAFNVAVFYFLGRVVNLIDIASLQAYGGDYFAFVLVGLAMGDYFGIALTEFSQSIRQEQTLGTLEAVLTAPVRLETVVFGSVLWGYLLTTLHLVLYLAAGAALGRLHLRQANLPAALVVLALSVAVYSSLGVLAASFVMVFKRGDPVTWLFQAASNMLGGMYYPVEVLPPLLQGLAAFLPVTYSLRAMRLALLEGAAWTALRGDIGTLAFFAALLLPFSLGMFRYAVRRARRDGTLVGY